MALMKPIITHELFTHLRVRSQTVMKNGFCVVACRQSVKVMNCRSKIAVLCTLKSKRCADIGSVRD